MNRIEKIRATVAMIEATAGKMADESAILEAIGDRIGEAAMSRGFAFIDVAVARGFICSDVVRFGGTFHRMYMTTTKGRAA